jgi:hypothetical protein
VKIRVEWRDNEQSPWRESHAVWTLDDVAYINRTVGYEKYRVTNVRAT